MLNNRFITSIVLGLLLACHKDRVLKPDYQRARVEEKERELETKPEYESPADESISIPASITGAYLMCTRIASDTTAMQQKVGCRVEAEGGVVVDDLRARMDKVTWSYQVQGSAVEIKALDAGSTSGWLAVFSIQADAASIQSKLTFDLSMTLDGAPTSVKTDLVLVWNEDCALPPIQFESLGDRIGLGATVGDQFKESHGLRFSTLSGTPVVLAGYNQATPVGYFGGPNNTANFLATNQNSGKFFITDRHKQAESTDTLVIDYDKAVKEASMDLVDIDFSETYVIRALNSQNQTVDEVTIQAAVLGARDGQLSRFVVRSPDGSSTISRLHIFGFNPPGSLGIGFGLDNFSPRCAR